MTIETVHAHLRATGRPATLAAVCLQAMAALAAGRPGEVIDLGALAIHRYGHRAPARALAEAVGLPTREAKP